MSQEQTQDNPVVVPAPPAAGEVPVLQKLSSPPFPRSGFPLLGIMASVYEHVISVAARGREQGGSAAGGGGLGAGVGGEPTNAPASQVPQSPQNTSG